MLKSYGVVGGGGLPDSSVRPLGLGLIGVLNWVGLGWDWGLTIYGLMYKRHVTRNVNKFSTNTRHKYFICQALNLLN